MKDLRFVFGEERYIEFDEDYGYFGVFGTESGFCYSQHNNSEDAEKKLMINWKDQHTLAMSHPKNGFESAITSAYFAAQEYAQAHLFRFNSPVGEDHVLGPEWVNWLRSIRALLNGETGRLDCGTMDRLLIELAEEHGMRLDDVWEK